MSKIGDFCIKREKGQTAHIIELFIKKLLGRLKQIQFANLQLDSRSLLNLHHIYIHHTLKFNRSHLVCLNELDLPEKLNQVETIPYKECDKILGSDWLIQEERGWRLEMIGLLLCGGLRMRPGEVDEEQNTLPPHRGLGELEFADLPSPLSDESLAVSNGPSNNIFAIGKPREISNLTPLPTPRFTCWELTWNGYKWIVNKPLLYSVIYNAFIKENT